MRHTSLEIYIFHCFIQTYKIEFYTVLCLIISMISRENMCEYDSRDGTKSVMQGLFISAINQIPYI